MYNDNDILIVGDSFCADRDHANTWPYRLLTHLTGKNKVQVRGAGYPGSSWWSTRVELLKQLENDICPKILILLHTEPSRIPSDYNFALNSTSVFEKSDLYYYPYTYINKSAEKYQKNPLQQKYNRDIRKAAQLYYRYLISDEFNEWAIYQWFNELDCKILPQYNIPIIIHLYSFETTMWAVYNQRYLFKNGITSLESMYELQCSIDINERNVAKDQNHFPLKYNHMIADSLYEFIVNYDSKLNGKNVNFNLLRR